MEFNSRTLGGLLAEADVLKEELSHVVIGRDSWLAGNDLDAWSDVNRQIDWALRGMMRADRWLKTHRGFLDGNVSSFRLRFSARMVIDTRPEVGQFAHRAPEHLRETIEAIDAFLGRLVEMDGRRRGGSRPIRGAIEAIRARLRRAGAEGCPEV